jgi:hypothetical protein
MLRGMNTLADVFRVLIEMRRDGVVADYAVGGAMAILFYAEPTRTYDLDVFVVLEDTGASKDLARRDLRLGPVPGLRRGRRARLDPRRPGAVPSGVQLPG